MNSRISYHGGWNSSGTEQMLGDILDAASKAPATAGPMTIYAATPTNVYRYDPSTHSLILHKAGDNRSDNTAAFEVGVAAGRMPDAGAAMHLAQLESVALWTGTAGQLASCPRASATTWANGHWNLPEPVDIVVSYGIRSVPGLTSTLVAISSDGTLPNPVTDGTVYLDNALSGLAYDSTFAARDLTLDEVSRILWASYGCSNHYAAGKAGLVCASAVANYYLTRRIYLVAGNGVYRYHVRRPPGTDAATRDHRLETLQTADVRAALRQGVPRLPVAPDYIVICVGTTGDWPELEVGFAAMGADLEATALNLSAYFTSGLSTAEQAAIRAATGIPAGELPISVVSLGEPSDISSAQAGDQSGQRLEVAGISPSHPVVIRFSLESAGAGDMAVYDCLGHEVKTLARGWQAAGGHVLEWDRTDAAGQAVPSGVYFFRLRAGGRVLGGRTVVLR